MIRTPLLFVLILCAGSARAQGTTQVDSPPRWGTNPVVTIDLTIGEKAPSDEYLFGRIEAITATSNGNIWVAESSIPQIRMFDADGRFLRNVGGPGDGPGEYNRLMGMKRTGDDHVVIFDPRSRRVTIYDADGEHVVSHRVDSGLNSTDVLYVAKDGTAFVKTMDMDVPRAPNGDPMMSMIQVSPEGESVGSVSLPPESDKNGFVLSTGSGFRSPFLSSRPTAISRDGFLVAADNQEYTVRVGDRAPLRRWPSIERSADSG
jgi:hypothetical protein